MFFKTKKQNEDFKLISTHLKKNVQFILEDLASGSSLPLLCKIRKFESDAKFLNGHVLRLQKRIYWIQKLTHIPEEEVTQ